MANEVKNIMSAINAIDNHKVMEALVAGKINPLRIWVLPKNDGEAIMTINLLIKMGEVVIVTSQAWGASWENLENEVKAIIQIAQKNGIHIFGMELQGPAPNGGENVDHHSYSGDDRSNPLSSLEQIASLIGVTLTPFEQAVAINDRGYIPSMQVAGISEAVIAEVRRLDRMAQGISEEQEMAAEEACSKKEVYGNLTIVRLPHSKTSTVCDRLFGDYTNLLVLSEDGETNFFGGGAIIDKLMASFPGGWSGGSLPENGFWGGYADQVEIEKLVKSLC